MDLTVRKTSALVVEDRSWLGDVDGTQATRSITLVVASFVKATHFPDGIIRSRAVIGRYTSGANNGLWGRYDDTATDGRQTAVGLLWNSLEVVDPYGNTSVKVGAPLQERGVVRTVAFAARDSFDAAAKVDLTPRFIFRD